MKCCVIGLGNFGYSVASTLSDNGIEVLAIDLDMEIVTRIKDIVTHAICMRVTDETVLMSVGIEHIDTVIIGIGEDFAQAVLITALCKKRLNIPTVITRARTELHKDILLLIGADQVVMPEQEIGIRLARSISSSEK